MSLLEALKAKGILEADDLKAYDSLLHQQGQSFRMFVAVAEDYKAQATALGLETGLPNAKKDRNPTPPESLHP